MASVDLCQVSGCGPEACPGDVVIDVVVEGAECLSELEGCLRLVGGGQRNEQSVVDLGVGDGDADAVGGEGIAVGVRESMDEAG